ncbi:hypothetical protein GCM10007884_20110 [Methylobacterium brachythecii]|uniref:Uncharacterized protein n=1 Tax=Methylobacterium brachythecii TaxID=1176177 RepID=A0ABQ6D2W3_9HYPH|nr:hypothetical protein GCM10007884_20110 [Methylobacterium brachythecii]
MDMEVDEADLLQHARHEMPSLRPDTIGESPARVEAGAHDGGDIHRACLARIRSRPGARSHSAVDGSPVEAAGNLRSVDRGQGYGPETDRSREEAERRELDQAGEKCVPDHDCACSRLMGQSLFLFCSV